MRFASLLLTALLPGLLLANEEGGRKDREEVWKDLMVVNRRSTSGKPTRLHQEVPRRVELAKGQNPPVIVLSCSDSRVPPEMVFDQGLGDLTILGGDGPSLP